MPYISDANFVSVSTVNVAAASPSPVDRIVTEAMEPITTEDGLRLVTERN